MKKPIVILGIETSCDETAAAIVRLTPDGQKHILANQILSQIETHAPYGGVVPELAARAHLQHLPRLVAAAMEEADCDWGDLSAIAATAGPGLVGGLLIGLTAAKTMALAHNLPFIGVNHLEAHALTPRLTEAELEFPYLLLLISGGHCQLKEVRGAGEAILYGSTRDDAVGEAYDKAAKLLGLGYPGGPAIEAAAKRGDIAAYKLPRPLINDKTAPYDFSFSGLKTALARAAKQESDAAPLTAQTIANLSASLQAAIGDCLVAKTQNALRRFSIANKQNKKLVIAGGVAANQYLRTRLAAAASAADFTLITPPPALCTDNAAMVAWAGIEKFNSANFTGDDLALSAYARDEKY